MREEEEEDCDFDPRGATRDGEDADWGSNEEVPPHKHPCLNPSFVRMNVDRVKAVKLVRSTINTQTCIEHSVSLTTLKRWERKGPQYAKTNPLK